MKIKNTDLFIYDKNGITIKKNIYIKYLYKKTINQQTIKKDCLTHL